MNKFIFYILILIINVIFITFLIFFFSYISLVNGKAFGIFWVNSVQKKIYFDAGFRNIWQTQKNCSEFDKHLLYKPKDGICEFNNPEFKTKITFRNGIRSNGQVFNNFDENKAIYFLGDSLAMGWGVNDEDTYISNLERLIKKKTYNLAVSSYGTVREVKKINNLKNLNYAEIIIIHYSYNDLFENLNLNITKEYEIKDFENIHSNNLINQNKVFFILKYFKKTFRILYNDVIKLFNPEKYFLKVDLEYHFNKAENIIRKNLKIKNKKIILFFTKSPEMKIVKYPKKSENIDYLILELDKKYFYKVDDHLNKEGHNFIAKELASYLKKFN